MAKVPTKTPVKRAPGDEGGSDIAPVSFPTPPASIDAPRPGAGQWEPVRTLILLRHAKSDWSAAAGGAEDLARPLARRGLKEAAALGAFLAAAGELPDRAVSSPAVRALETLRLAMAAAGWRGRLERSDALYGSLEAALGELASQPDSASSVLFVGHEPTSSTLAGLLIGSGRLEMKTAACCRIDLDAERWSDAPAKGGRLCWLVSGRLLRRISG